MNDETEFWLDIPADEAGRRLDQVLARLHPDITRSHWQQWIEGGRVTINGRVPRKRDAVRGGEQVRVVVPKAVPGTSPRQAIPLNVIYEDAQILVIDKPAGLVVHPGAGNASGTLLNGLLHRLPSLDALPRAGIVHRLDKNTSGLLVVAKTESARQRLIAQLQDRTMSREYQAIVSGVLIAGRTVDAPVGRHRVDRTRMAVSERGKAAVSHVRVLKKFRSHTLVQVRLESGRTHQIRVHMAHIGYPVLGDPVYGGRRRVPKGASRELGEQLAHFARQALHAARLSVQHPETGERLQWESPLPTDMRNMISALELDVQAATRAEAGASSR